MRRLIPTMLASLMVSGAAYAVDPGRAEGAVVVDGNRIDVYYAYAINHQKNEITNRKDDTRVVLTSKPLPDNVDLGEIDYAFPDGTFGMVVCITHNEKVSHILVQYPKGMYDGGYFDGDDHYSYKPLKIEHGSIGGNVSGRKVRTNTMTFTFDADFNAAVK